MGRLAQLPLLLLAGCASSRQVPRQPLLLAAAHEEPEFVTSMHTVAQGETLFAIARRYGLSPADLAAANGVDDPNALAVGQELVIPAASPLLAAPSVQAQLGAAASQRAPTAAGKGDGTLSWPIRGVLYARFGRKGKEPHDGIDLAAPSGTPVATAAPGTVLFAGEQKGYGLIVIVEHGRGLVTLYAHNRDLRVKSGQGVRSGQLIATVGESGKTSGPHLHFEVRRDGVPVDPLVYLGPLPP